MDDTSIVGDNRGLATRGTYARNSRIVELMELFFQEKLLLNGTDISLKFIWSKDKFSLMTAANVQYHVKIMSASVFVKKSLCSPNGVLGSQQSSTAF